MSERVPAPLLAGALSGFAVAEVLQLLELGARTGVLVVDGGPAGAGRVWLRDGRILAASVEGSDSPVVGGATAHVAALLDVSVGRWAFHSADHAPAAVDAVARPDDGVRISAVLVEAARLRDERARATPVGAGGADVPSADVPRLAGGGEPPEPGATPGRLTSADLRVLAAVDGVRSASEIAAAVGRDPASVRDALERLRAVGVLRREPVGTEHAA